MAEIGKLKTFFDAIGYEEKQKERIDPKKGRYPFITISRQTGAGGHRLASAILSQMEERKGLPVFEGWQMCDREICKLIAEDPNLHVSMHSLLSSEYHSVIEDILDQLVAGITSQDVVIKKMFKIIRTLAVFGKVVFVGHAASTLTRQLPLGLHIRLVASEESRVRRMMQLLDLKYDEAKKMTHNQDKARKKLIKNYFNKDINDPLLYDAGFNSDTVAIDDIAKAVLEMVKQKSAHVLQP